MTRQVDPVLARAEMDRELLVEQLARLSAGDKLALAVVYRLTSGKLNALILRMVRDEAVAQEVLQDVYLTVWRRSASFDPRLASPITWLATIARNKAIDRLRAQKRRPAGSVSAEEVELIDPSLSVVEELEIQQDRLQLYACLDRLDERHRGAIRAAFFEGVTYEALAARAGVPLGTMKSWIRRGLLRLRVCMDA
jgi:RNA polymerase sigma-70 factor (ECF subfamily)